MYYNHAGDHFPIRPLTPDDGHHYFFGYYDLYPYHESGKYHLANRVEFMDRMPEKDDVCTLGRINMENGEFEPFAKTTAWNFQQGALMTYNIANYDEVFYNVRQGDGYATCIHNLATGEKRYTDRACANISLDGKKGVAINFDRIYDFRPGYGYAGNKDPWYDIPQPEDDGVYLVDMESGKSKFLVSVADMVNCCPNPDYAEAKFVINHITLNPSGDKYLALLRNFGTADGKIKWRTSLIIGDMEGNVRNALPYTIISHYHWRDDDTMIIYARIGEDQGFFVINVETGEYEYITEPSLKGDFHCLYTHDRKYFIGCGYPDGANRRAMFIYNFANGKRTNIVHDFSTPTDNTDIRCDLHNRFDPTGMKISFDSTRNGRREILEADITDYFKSQEK